ncbi:unnamed protein product, partial [Rotaria magnacalcarata]
MAIFSILGIPTRSGINYKILIYGITGDCPAIKLAIKHVNHQGYWCCWFCYIRGVHIHHKRQYYFKKELALRSTAEYALYSHGAEETKTNIYGHLGVSPLSLIIDVPLPRCLVIDYMHVSLLRHTRTVIQYIYGNFLKPKQREELDELFRNQPFPHFFNRKMRPVKEFSYCKATELRNMLLHGLLPLIRLFLPIECAAHLALYVTAMRLFHGPRTIGNDTETVANELMAMYYKHHTLFYENIQNFVLHLHSHFMDQYRLHGSLSNLGTFGQESLIGHFANNRNGTRNLGQLIINNYNVDFTIVNQLHHHLSDVPVKSNGLFDSHDALINNFLLKTHNDLCFCDNANQCIRIYRRYRIDAMIYHSLIYHRRGSSKISIYIRASRAVSYLILSFYTYYIQMTSRRQVLPRQVFTPTQGTPPPSHYLLFFEDTNSYQIAARSSLKKINGDVVFIMIRNKLVKTKSAYHGSLEECNSEYLRLTRVSQNESFNDDDGHSITDPITLDLDDSIMQNSMYPRTGSLHSLLSIEPRKRNLTSIASPEKTSDE